MQDLKGMQDMMRGIGFAWLRVNHAVPTLPMLTPSTSLPQGEASSSRAHRDGPPAPRCARATAARAAVAAPPSCCAQNGAGDEALPLPLRRPLHSAHRGPSGKQRKQRCGLGWHCGRRHRLGLWHSVVFHPFSPVSPPFHLFSTRFH